MSEVRGKKKVPLRRILVRSALVAVYVGLMVLVFVFGKGHTILVDNKDVEGMANLTAFDDVVVGMDKQETTELTSGDRDMFKVTGQRHRITLEIMGRPDKVVKEITIPLNADMTLISLPKLVAGVEPYTEPFVPVEVATPSRDEESFTISNTDQAIPDANQPVDATQAPAAGSAPAAAPAAAKP